MTGKVVDLKTGKPVKAQRPPCAASKKNGEPCSNRAKAGSEYCGSHADCGVGRPRALTAEKHEKLMRALRAGSTLGDAAIFAEVSESTLTHYISDGRKALEAGKEDDPLAELLAEVTAAMIGVKVLATGTVVQAMTKGNVHAALSYLERRHPQEWSKTETHEHSHTHSGVLGVVELLGGQQPMHVDWRKRERIAAILAEEDVIEGSVAS